MYPSTNTSLPIYGKRFSLFFFERPFFFPIIIVYTYAVCTICYLDVISVHYLIYLPGLTAIGFWANGTIIVPFFPTFLSVLLWCVWDRSSIFYVSVSLPAYLHASVAYIRFVSAYLWCNIRRICISRNHSTFIRVMKLANQIYR